MTCNIKRKLYLPVPVTCNTKNQKNLSSANASTRERERERVPGRTAGCGNRPTFPPEKESALLANDREASKSLLPLLLNGDDDNDDNMTVLARVENNEFIETNERVHNCCNESRNERIARAPNLFSLPLSKERRHRSARRDRGLPPVAETSPSLPWPRFQRVFRVSGTRCRRPPPPFCTFSDRCCRAAGRERTGKGRGTMASVSEMNAVGRQRGPPGTMGWDSTPNPTRLFRNFGLGSPRRPTLDSTTRLTCSDPSTASRSPCRRRTRRAGPSVCWRSEAKSSAHTHEDEAKPALSRASRERKGASGRGRRGGRRARVGVDGPLSPPRPNSPPSASRPRFIRRSMKTYTVPKQPITASPSLRQTLGSRSRFLHLKKAIETSLHRSPMCLCAAYNTLEVGTISESPISCCDLSLRPFDPASICLSSGFAACQYCRLTWGEGHERERGDEGSKSRDLRKRSRSLSLIGPSSSRVKQRSKKAKRSGT